MGTPSAVRLAQRVREGDRFAAFLLIRRMKSRSLVAAIDALFPVRGRLTVQAFDALADAMELAKQPGMDEEHARAVLSEHDLSPTDP